MKHTSTFIAVLFSLAVLVRGQDAVPKFNTGQVGMYSDPEDIAAVVKSDPEDTPASMSPPGMMHAAPLEETKRAPSAEASPKAEEKEKEKKPAAAQKKAPTTGAKPSKSNQEKGKKSKKFKAEFPISLVAGVRNDNYGNNFMHRLQIFVEQFCLGSIYAKAKVELVLVEYNPPWNKERIIDAVKWPKDCGKSEIVVVTFPRNLHWPLPNSDKFPMFEYRAKNVGIRRARGAWIAAMNPDNLFSHKMWRWIADFDIDVYPDAFYRLDRIDTRRYIPSGSSLDEAMRIVHLGPVAYHGHGNFGPCQFASQDLSKKDGLKAGLTEMRTASLNGTMQLDFISNIPPTLVMCSMIFNDETNTRKFFIWLDRKLENYKAPKPSRPESCRDLNLNGAGDFLMMHRDSWERIKGYEETRETTDQNDSIGVVIASSWGKMRQINIFEEGVRMFQMDHDRSERKARPERNLKDIADYCENFRTLERGPYNLDDWGSENEQLETVIAIGKISEKIEL